MSGEPTAAQASARHRSLEEWFSKLSPKLQQLVHEAENQAWPFVYEEWQFEQDTQKESVNIKDLVLSKNEVYPDMLEKDVLKECLEHAHREKAYKMAAAVAFLLDRFMYWYGNTEYILKKVEQIRREAPTTPIAPQVILRKARFLKDGGSLQNADKTLDFILYDKRHKDQWQYKEDSQYDLVYATCVQVKGVIKHNLGLWLEAADLVLESLLRYHNLPKPDLKGIGSSLGILSDVLMKISIPDFKLLLTKYACRYEHPLMEAYAANKQAAWLARFEPFYYARHTRRAGEVLLMFVVTLPPEERASLVKQAIEDLKTSLRGHISLSTLTSKEQLYEFTCALYQSVIAMCLLATKEAIATGTKIEKYCMVIYDYYSASTGILTLEEDFVQAIHAALRLLELPELSHSPSEKNALVDLPPYDYQYPTLRGVQLPSSQNRGQGQPPSADPDQNSNKAPKTRHRKRSKRHEKEIEEETAGSVEQGKVEVPQDEKDITVADPSATTLLPSASGEKSSAGMDVRAPAADPLIAQAPASHPVIEEDPDAPTLPTNKLIQSGGRGGEVPAVLPDAGGAPPNDVHLPGVDRVVADDSSIEGASVDTGYSGSSRGSTGPEDAFLYNDPAAEVDEYVESVVPEKKVEEPAVLPEMFVQPDPANPISSFMDASVSALSRRSLEPEASVPVSKSITAQDLILHVESLTLEPLSVHRARVFKFDAAQSIWTCLTTLVYLDEELEVRRKGAMRDVIKLQYLNQEEPRARYVGKRYRKPELKSELKNYYQDVLCQMTARHYVALFNQALKDHPQPWQIQFVPAAHVQLLSDDHQDIVDVFNVEPYVEGSKFVKVTNNWKYVNKGLNPKLIDVSLAFMHFTFDRSEGKVLVTDLQGWLPQDQAGTIIFTDPAIHSDLTCFETANLGKEGVEAFWRHQHPVCNDVCKSLGLKQSE